VIGPTLETPRLILRPPAQRDLDAWAAFMGDEEAALFVGGLQSRSGAWRFMAATAGSWVLKGFGMFSVIEKASGRWIGRVGPLQPEGWPGPEVGWGLAREAWGRGLATEAAARTMDWAFDSLGWREIIHCIHPDNHPSIRVAERLGSRRLGSDRLPAPFDSEEVDIWGQSAEDWRRRRGAG
jgi:RimJ/RimL family protein N-acetyltransferase